MGRRNPLTDWAQFFLGERYPWHNHARQIRWRSLKGFRGSCESNFSISHWLCWSSLQHSHTTVWACDSRKDGASGWFCLGGSVLLSFSQCFDTVSWAKCFPFRDSYFARQITWLSVNAIDALMMTLAGSPCAYNAYTTRAHRNSRSHRWQLIAGTSLEPGQCNNILGSSDFLSAIVPIRYDTRCYFNARSKADISQLNLSHEVFLSIPCFR